MKTTTKIKTILIVIFVIIFSVIAARHFVGLHFQKKFNVNARLRAFTIKKTSITALDLTTIK